MQVFTKNSKARFILIGIVLTGLVLPGCTAKKDIASPIRTVQVLTVGGQKC